MTSVVYTQCCLPRRLRTPIERTHTHACSECNTPCKFYGYTTMAYRCTNRVEVGRIHSFGIGFCDAACYTAFVTSLKTDGFTGVVAFSPIPVGDLVESPALKEYEMDRFRLILRAITSGRVCDNCTAHHLEGTPSFKLCSACMNARYCSPECQMEHWTAEHKNECGKPPIILSMKASPNTKKKVSALFNNQTDEEAAHSECFDERQLYHRTAFRTGVCSYSACGKKPLGPFAIEFTLDMCFKGSQSAHITPLAYCNRRCRERDSRGQMGTGIGSRAGKR